MQLEYGEDFNCLFIYDLQLRIVTENKLTLIKKNNLFRFSY